MFVLTIMNQLSYPQVICDISIEHGPVEIVSFYIHSMVDLCSSLCHLVSRINGDCPIINAASGDFVEGIRIVTNAAIYL